MSIADKHIRWEGMVNSQLRLWHKRGGHFIRKPTAGHGISKWDEAHITISRQYGARGYRIGQIIGGRLGWEVYSKNLLEQILATEKLRHAEIEDFDEKYRPVGLSQLLFEPNAFSTDKCFRQLAKLVSSLADRGRAVFVGRGANFIADAEKGLHVRVTASLDYRIRRYAEKAKVTYKEARNKVLGVDIERAEFVKRYFHCRIDDPHQYDLTINVEQLSDEQVADIILAALEVKLGEKRLTMTAEAQMESVNALFLTVS